VDRIGKDAAMKLASLKYYVVAGIRKAADAESMKGQSEFLYPIVMDIVKEEDCKRAVEFAAQLALEKNVKFLGLVNNAGVSNSFMPLEWEKEVELRRVMEVNLFGTARMTQLCLPHLRKSHGRIVVLSSIAGRVCNQGLGAYTISKHAIEGYFGVLRRELFSKGVSLSIINAACIKTKIWADISATEPSASVAKLDDSYDDLIERITKYHLSDLCEQLADSAEVSSTPCIVHALTAAYPATQYYPGNFCGDASRLVMLMNWILPDRVMDYYLSGPIFWISRKRFPSYDAQVKEARS
jgi:NAD(P)-dependent dehydrogenase (short-subunit alcohol dehydrogenase family)